MTWIDEILSRFQKVKAATDRPLTWWACCPAHKDRSPSLSIWVGREGQVLIRCWSKQRSCTLDAILAQVNLKLRDLFPPKENGARRMTPMMPPRIVQTYDYTDEHGSLLYQSVRFEPKSFKRRRPLPEGGWAWSVPDDVRHVLYNLPFIKERESETVCLVEGEKDADLLFELGFLSTTNIGGSSGWRDEYSESLSGRKVAVCIDNDNPGVERASSVRLIVPPTGKDVYDWLSPLLADARAAFLKVARAAKEWGS
jgi:putative DNA primase/helicase